MALKIRSVQNFCAAVMFIVMGGAFGIGALNYSMGTAARMGPGYFPTILGWLTVILGILVLIESFTVETDRPSKIAWKPLLSVVGAVWLFGLMIDTAGLIPAVVVQILLSSWGGPNFRWKESIISAIFLSFAGWVMFDLLLGLPFRLFPWSY